MALDDRERNFEKALARELRAEVLKAPHCPDAETLAAYHERMLLPEEMVAQKSHVAGCARCQEILATLELTEAIPISDQDSQEVVAGAKRGSVTAMPKRRTYLRWVLPVGAIAAGILVLVAVRTNRAPTMRSSDTAVQVAENREAAKEESYSAKAPQSVAAPSPAVAGKATGKMQEEEKQESDAFTSGHRATDLTRGRAGSGTGAGHGPGLAQNQMQNQIQNNGQITAQNQASRTFDGKADKKANELPLATRNGDSAAVADNVPRRSESTMKAKAAPAAPVAPSPSPSEQSYVAGAAASAAKAAKPTEADARKDEAAKSMAESVEVTAEAPISRAEQKEMETGQSALLKLKAAQAMGGAAGNLRDASTGGLTLVATPDPNVFWVIGSNGTVLKTEDGETTLRQQKIGEGIRVLAGSAVDKKVCWLIADKGIVLRTTDGGKHWTTMNAPNAADFTTIKAASALQATISDAGGHVVYFTTDGGATWTSTPRP